MPTKRFFMPYSMERYWYRSSSGLVFTSDRVVVEVINQKHGMIQSSQRSNQWSQKQNVDSTYESVVNV